METPRIATIGLLLSVILIARLVMGEPADRPKGPSAGASASVLLQEGLYAEEIEGDLDGAIKIYERVLVEAKDVEQAAAQATYRIGICFLKKGDKAKAAEHFQRLILAHPGQKSVVEKAQEQLTKLGFTQSEPSKLVPADELVRSGRAPAFKAKIVDNSALDLEKAALLTESARTNQNLEQYDVAWDNDGGGALMVVPGSPARILALPAAENWQQAISKARDAVSLLRESTSKSLLESPSKFAAVLTGAGNLAVIEIGEHDSNQAALSWWLESIPAQQLKSNIYEQLPWEVIQFVGGKYGSISSEAAAKNLYSNSHIYYVTSDWVLLTGGMGYYRNSSDQARSEKVRLSGTSSLNQTLYDVAGRQMNTEIVQDKVRSGFYHIYWTPSEAIPPGQMFYYGWSNDQSRMLRPAAGSGQYKLTMQNHFGERVIETFLLVVPVNTSIISRTEDFTAKDTVGGFDIYHWSKEAPPNTDHKVDVTLGVSQEQLAEIVRKAVLTISTCAESDPRVAESLDSLKPFKDAPAINELCKYLESDTANVRRSAIFILWRGGFKDIAPAEEKLIKLCGHEENFTRGMSLLALGTGKVAAGYEILADKTLNDSDGYVRRCAAYALGLYGDKKAVPVLEKALQDKDPLVKNNAQAAITMLTELKDTEQK